MKTKRKFNFFDKLFFLFTVILCASILISYLAPYCDPSSYWLIAFFGLAYPVLLPAVAVMAIYWLLRRSIWVLLPVICILAGWKVMNESIGFRTHPSYDAARDTNNIRVLTYNVHSFQKYGSKTDFSAMHDILDIINQQQPTIVCMQEFFSYDQGPRDVLDSLQAVLHTTYNYHEVFRKHYERRYAPSVGFFGMAIISKLPVVDTGFIQISESKRNDDQCLYADVKKGDKIFRIYNVHLQSIKFDPKDYSYLNEVAAEGKTDVNSTKRMWSKLKIAFIKRSGQISLIKQHAAQCPHPYIIAGDFNDTPGSFSVNQMEKGLKNSFCEKGSGLGITYNGDFPNFQIDYVMASPAFNIMNYDIVKQKLSDHYPVYSDMVLK